MRDLEDEGVASLLLSGRVSLTKDFRSRRLPESEATARGAAGAIAIELIPVKKKTDVERVILVMHEDRLLIRSVSIISHDGDRMTLELIDLQENTDLADALFRFEPPPGVDVLTDR